MTSSSPVTISEALLIIDSTVQVSEQWLATMTGYVTVYRVNPEQDALSRICAIVALHSGVASVHLVSHGVPGALVLGDGQVDTAALMQNAALLRSIGERLAPGADLLLYGCDVGAGEAGKIFVDTLAHLTGANVAASDDATGDSVHGGDWELEITCGFIKTPMLHLPGLSGTLSTPGNDTVIGTAGNDTLYGGDGNDQISAQAGDDELYGEAGDDSLAGFDGNDSLFGGAGNDLLLGLNQDDYLSGGDGNDTLSGGAGNDIFFGDDGNDVLRGGTGDDVLYGGAGNDSLVGEAGNDTLYGGAGIDTLSGGTNNDVFIGSVADFDSDTITDFSMADSLVVTGADLSALNATAAGAALDLGGGQSLALTGITSASGNFNAIFSGGNTTITLVAAPTGPATVALTTGADAPALTSFDDTITAGLASSLNAGDVINGQGGADTLEISAAQTVVLGATTLTNVETVTITAGIQSITTHDATVGAGKSLTVNASASAGALTWNGSAETDGTFSITGGSGQDSLTGGAGADTLTGNAANDFISGGAGNDTLYGGDGDDTLGGGAGSDSLYGGAGNDAFAGSAAEFDGDTLADFAVGDSIVVTGADLSALNGTAASATLDLGSGQNLALTDITTSSGNLNAIFSGGNTTITLTVPTGPAAVALTTGADAPGLTSFDDTITASLASSLNAGDAINGQGGADTLEISAAQTVVLGSTTLTNVETITITARIQNLTTHDATVGAGQTLTINASASTSALTWIGSAETDGKFAITGGSGNDSIRGGAGGDTLHGGTGNDTLYGGAGLDTLYGGDGNDFLYGGTDNALIYGDGGNDGLSGSSSEDTIYGGTGNDTLIGDDGNDTLNGGDGNDWIWGQNGNDVVYGGSGSDTLSGDAGNDTLYGDEGNDTISGGADSDALYGGDGNDVLRGNAGTDTLYGDAGDDVFAGSAAELDGDTIADFTVNDSIAVSGVDLSALKGTNASGTIALGSGQALTLTGITAGSGTFDAIYSGGTTTISLIAPVAEPEPAPEPPVVEQIDGVNVQITLDAAGNQTVRIPVVSPSRLDDPGTALATHAEVPVATSASGQALLTLGVPVGSGMVVQGPAVPLTPTAATNSLLRSISVTTGAGPASNAAMNESARSYLESLPPNSIVTVKTIVPTMPSWQASFGSVLVSGTVGEHISLVIDVRSMPQAAVLRVDNIGFAAIVGSATIRGGAGSNQVVGDDASQIIILGAGDDILHGGGGNDTVGSLTGNDQAFGDAGNDKVYGGAGHDSLSGGLGNDSLNGGFGFDIALAEDNRADYDITLQGDGIVLTHLSTGEVDHLIDVEQVHFASGEVLTIPHDEMEAVAWHLVNTWLHRNLTREEAEQVQSIGKGASINDLVQAFKTLLAPEDVKQLGTAELLAGLEDNSAIIRLSDQRQAYVGDNTSNQGYLPMGAAFAADGAGGHDVLQLEGGRDDYDLQANNDVLLITRYEDGAMIGLRNAEMVSFDSGETTVLAHGTIEAILGRLVQTFFGRSATVEEWRLGRTALANDVAHEQILDWFEARAGLEQLRDSDYVQALYQNTFGRQANGTELQAHLARLDDENFDRSLLAIDIAQSEEAITTVGSVINFDNWI